MAHDPLERRLAAVLAADMVGYTRLMEADEAGTIARQKKHRKALIDPKIAAHRGRIVKTTGDGMLVEFASVVDAVESAVAIQQAMAAREADIPEDRRIRYRIGINLGDIVFDGDDILGDGVNIAARLEGIAEPGGICLSGTVYEQVFSKLDLAFDDRGEQNLKNVARPIRAYGVVLGAAGADASAAGRREVRQDIRFCTAPDGVRIAYATAGEGAPLVKAANWMTHLEYDWESPIWGHLVQDLARDHLLLRYDQRANGLSDWDVGDISFETFVSDLETAVDAAGLDRFGLLGISQGCAASIADAVRHPDRVTHLVLYGGYARGLAKRGDSEARKAEHEAVITLMLQGWGKDNPVYRQLFTSQFVPGATKEQEQWFNDLQRVTTSPENAARLRRANNDIDVTRLLPQVAAPTLVMHCRGDLVVPFEEGRMLAARIPRARFVALEGNNHLILEHEPSWPRFLGEIRGFLGGADRPA